jgi:hypothetical protein
MLAGVPAGWLDALVHEAGPRNPMPVTQVVSGDRAGRARAGSRCPRMGHGVIAQDFAFSEF